MAQSDPWVWRLIVVFTGLIGLAVIAAIGLLAIKGADGGVTQILALVNLVLSSAALNAALSARNVAQRAVDQTTNGGGKQP